MKLFWLLTLLSSLGACEQASPKLSGGSPGAYVAPDGTCPATCSTPGGNVQSFASDADTWAALIGVWQICSGAHSAFGAPADTIGVEFAPPHTDLPYDATPTLGNLFFLIQGPSGPVRGGGFDYQQTYEVDTWGVLACHPYYNSQYGFNLKYSPCPRQWNLTGVQVALLVPF